MARKRADDDDECPFPRGGGASGRADITTGISRHTANTWHKRDDEPTPLLGERRRAFFDHFPSPRVAIIV